MSNRIMTDAEFNIIADKIKSALPEEMDGMTLTNLLGCIMYHYVQDGEKTAILFAVAQEFILTQPANTGLEVRNDAD